MKNTRYTGKFLDVNSVKWRVDILQEGWDGEVGDLDFPAENPLTIEWEEKDKIEPIQGSSATLTVISPGDRTYIDLYTMTSSDIVLRVYREDVLYWCGSLDPEFYEEPYESADGYEVSLTFTDFGSLKRIKWDGEEFKTLDEIVRSAIELACINATTYQLKCSTMLYSKTLTLLDVSISSANFYDEDNEPNTYYEVLEAILQPLALRIIQRAGKVWVYDTNSLAKGAATGNIEWSSDSQTLAADKVVNKCVVTFSPYAKAEIYNGVVNEGDVVKGTGGAMYYLQNPYTEPKLPGFSLYYATSNKLPYTLHSGQLVLFDAGFSSANGVAVIIGRRGHEDSHYTQIIGTIAKAYPYGFDKATSAQPCLTTTPAFLGNPAGLRDNFKLKIEVESLVDVRYNPYESASLENEEGAWSRLQNRANFGYIPGTLLLKDKEGNILYHFDNRLAVTTNGLSETPGEWVAGEPSRQDTYMLCWYSTNDRKTASGFGGWQQNQAIIGYYRDDMPTLYEKRGSGDYIPLPPAVGYLELTLFNRVYQFDYNREEKDIYSELRWVGLKDPKISVVDKWGLDIDEEDIEVSAWINRLAADEMSISTMCGTMDNAMPTARGVFLSTADHLPISSKHFKRAGVTDGLERLLIGTIYSQYANRHTKLSGECEIIADGLPVCTEDNQPSSARFILAGETQDIIAGTSEAIWVEVLEDNYEGIEFEE